METGILHLHSLLRWVVLILMLVAIAKAATSKNSGSFGGTRKWALFSMISLHLQLVLGLALYFMKNWYQMVGQSGFMKDTYVRFFTVEHLLMMLIAIVLATAGYSTAKRMSDPGKANKRILVFFVIALVLILASIPWPFREAFSSRSWI